MPEYLTPGVYIEETSDVPRGIEGLSTSVAGFVGPTRFGPAEGAPPPLTGFGEFERVYGGLEQLSFSGAARPNDLAQAVRGFFENGGRRLYVARVYESATDGRARCEIGMGAGVIPMVLRARHPGEAGNGTVTVEAKAHQGAALSEVTLTVTVGDRVWEGVHPDPEASGSLTQIFRPALSDPALAETPLEVEAPGLADGEAVLERLFGSLDQLTTDLASGTARASFALTGGSDGTRPGPASYASALASFEEIEEISIVAAPGSSRGGGDGDPIQSLDVARLLIAHCERLAYRIAVLDSPESMQPAEVLRHRAQLDSSHAAYYYPWVEIVDPLTGGRLTTPPSGLVAGVYARTDTERGVHQAPANADVRLAVGLELLLDRAQQEQLNPAGVNCLRYFEGRGYLVWGARTLSSDPEWKYVNLRRYFAYLEHSIDRGTRWAVFEANGAPLWTSVRRTVEDFLLGEFRAGHLMGQSPDEAFFVKCDLSTMTQNDIDNGRLVCLVGVAAVRPAEFVIFRIGQRTRDFED